MHVRYTFATINIFIVDVYWSLPVCLSLSLSLSLCLSVCLSVCLSLSLTLLECIHSTYLLQFQSSQEGVVRQCEHRMEQCRVLKNNHIIIISLILLDVT